MTCIVGLKHKNKIWIGGDAAASDGSFICQRNDVKAFKRDNYLIGFTTSFRMGDILKYKVNFPKCRTLDITKFMATDFIDSIIESFKQNGFGNKGESGDMGGSFLVGFKNNLYHVDADFQVASLKDDYYAVGSGAHFAFGAMYAAKEYSCNPKEIVTIALEAAAKFSPGVSAPFTIIHS